jgi:hypothetical protein
LKHYFIQKYKKFIRLMEFRYIQFRILGKSTISFTNRRISGLPSPTIKAKLNKN